jgi:hypothetical protein
MCGGGIRSGFLYGKTADERPCTSIENPVPVTDIHATIFRTLGIPPTYHLETEKRPFYITKDGKGRPIQAVFSAS